MAPSLNISDLTKSGLFQTSGSIPLTDPAANLFFIKPDGTAGHLQFPYPAAESADFTALLESCKPASFGRGQKDVLDPSYRKALCLPAASLALSAPLQLPSSILQEIQRLLQPQAAAVTAALDKLNVYGPDGFFKSHVDTPRAPHMFGSLVVCLPTEFAGGELVLRGPAGVQYTQHWGRSSAESPALQWAAFYSDVEHEIMPVTSGYRVTLTYNLYHASGDSPAAAAPLRLVNPGQSLFGESLAACLKDASWHSKGSTLGFTLEHYYAANSRPPAELEPEALKGCDLLLYQALSSAGLSPKLVPLLRTGLGFDASYLWKDLPSFLKEDEQQQEEEEEQQTEQQQQKMEEEKEEEEEEQQDGDESSKDDDWRMCKPELLLGSSFGGPQRLGEPEYDSDDHEYYCCDLDAGPGRVWRLDDDTTRKRKRALERDFLATRHGASRPSPDFVWAKPPSKEHWLYKDRVSAHTGNESCKAVWYVAAALTVEVPACGVGCRAST